MAELVKGDIMGHALTSHQPAKLFHMKPREPRTSWHYDWRGKLTLSALWAGIWISGLTTVGSILYVVAHHVHH